MGLVIKQLVVDLWQKILQPITVVQGEKAGRVLAITLTGAGLPVNLTGCGVIFYAQKPDGNILFNDCVIVDEAAGRADYTIEEQDVIVAGTLKCWIVIIKTGATIRSQQFNITVQESPDFTPAVESTSTFSDLEVALATIAGFDGRLTTAEGDIDDLETAMSAAEGEIDTLQSNVIDLDDRLDTAEDNIYYLNSAVGSIWTQLWTGNWSSGNITVPNFDKYNLFKIQISNLTAGLLAVAQSGYLRGGMIYAASDTAAYSLQLGATYSGTTLTMGYCHRGSHVASGNHGPLTTESVTEIVGVL